MCSFFFCLVCFLVVVPLFISAFTYALFWFETASSPYRNALERMSGGRVAWWIFRGFLSSALSSFLVLVTYPFGFLRRVLNPEIDEACKRPPVLLIHGLYHNASAWIIFRHRLKASGYSNVFTLNYCSWTQSFGEVLDRVDSRVAELNHRFPEQPVILIGHSLGGLLSHAYLQRHAGTRKVATLVTLGTPHHGSKLAALGPGKLAQSILYRGRLVEDIANGPPVTSIPLMALYSPVDNMVLPFDALLPEGKEWIHEPIAPVSHVAMLYHAGTASKVIDHLQRIGREAGSS